MRKQQVTSRFDDDALKKMDELIKKKKFDSRASLIRYAVNNYLESQERVILA